MAFNSASISGRNGIIRIVTLILGVIILALAADTYIKNYSKEEFFLAMVVILLVISVIWVILSVFEIVAGSDATKKFDFGFHMIGGLILLIAAIVWLVSAFEIGEPTACKIWNINCGNFYIKRVIVGFLGILNGVLYVLLGYYLYQAN